MATSLPQERRALSSAVAVLCIVRPNPRHGSFRPHVFNDDPARSTSSEAAQSSPTAIPWPNGRRYSRHRRSTMSDEDVLGTPEASIVTIVESYVQLSRLGFPEREILRRIEKHRSMIGADTMPSPLTPEAVDRYRGPWLRARRRSVMRRSTVRFAQPESISRRRDDPKARTPPKE